MIAKAVMGLTLALAATVQAAEPSGPWTFQVLLDGKPIGTHAFRLSGSAEQRDVHSEADFAVKLIGVTVYSYRHRATERWQGNCLAGLDAQTDDGGKASAVKARREGDALALTTPEGTQTVPGCTMTFAYWNPQMLKQTRLLNPQTGKLEPVRIQDLGEKTLTVRGASVPARHWRVDAADGPIELWYSPAGDWLALESKVKGRTLAYRRD